MARDRKTIGQCPNCPGQNLTCTWNHFERGDLVIDSWEHKCLDCGLRDTTAYRTDDEDDDDDDATVEPADRRVCPYCSRTGELTEH